MATQTVTKERAQAAGGAGYLDGFPQGGLLGGGSPPPDGRRCGHGPDGESYRAAARTAVVGAWLLVAAVAMLFVGFTSTYLVRRTGPGWLDGPMPALLYLNPAAILASSAVLERGRMLGRAGRIGGLSRCLLWAAALGAAFVAGQAAAWWQLFSQGLTPAWGPHVSFFYLLSGMHALHVLAGLGWLALGWARSRRALAYDEVRATVDSGAVFWHFVGVLWVYLWGLLFWI